VARSSKKVFSLTNNIKSRRNYQDYDYLDKLSKSDKEFLAKFTDEYYSASYDLSAVFVERVKLVKFLSKLEQTDRVIAQVKYYSEKTEEKVCINNTSKKLNVDLRRIKGLKKYFLDENGDFSTKKKYKYSDTNIHKPSKYRADSELRDRVQKRDVMNVEKQELSLDDEGAIDIIDNIISPDMSPEDREILSEEMELRVSMKKQCKVYPLGYERKF
jgi:hypothetical protein